MARLLRLGLELGLMPKRYGVSRRVWRKRIRACHRMSGLQRAVQGLSPALGIDRRMRLLRSVSRDGETVIR